MNIMDVFLSMLEGRYGFYYSWCHHKSKSTKDPASGFLGVACIRHHPQATMIASKSTVTMMWSTDSVSSLLAHMCFVAPIASQLMVLPIVDAVPKCRLSPSVPILSSTSSPHKLYIDYSYYKLNDF